MGQDAQRRGVRQLADYVEGGTPRVASSIVPLLDISISFYILPQRGGPPRLASPRGWLLNWPPNYGLANSDRRSLCPPVAGSFGCCRRELAPDLGFGTWFPRPPVPQGDKLGLVRFQRPILIHGCLLPPKKLGLAKHRCLTGFVSMESRCRWSVAPPYGNLALAPQQQDQPIQFGVPIDSGCCHH